MNKKLFIWILVLIVLTSFASAELNDSEMYLSFDEGNFSGTDIYDLSGNLKNGTSFGATLGSVAGILNYSVDFDGTNDHVNTETVAPASEYSISYWMNINTMQTGDIIFSHSNTGSTSRNSYAQILSGSTFTWTVRNSAQNAWYGITLTGINANTWNYYTLIRNSSGVYAYVNETLNAQNVVSFTSATTDVEFIIGTHPNGASNPTDMQLDEFALYNKDLSISEISELYNLGAGFNPYAIPPTPPISVTINLTTPINNTYTNNLTNDFVFNVTSTENISACSLYINDVVNKTNSSIGGLFNFTSIIEQTLPVGEYNWTISCSNGTTNFNSTQTNTLIIDIVPPQINLTGIFQNKLVINNLSGLFEFSDDNLYSINISDSVTGTIFNISGITSTTYNYTLNHDVSAYNSGSHILNIRVADGHTSTYIKPYKLKNDWLDNGIKYEFDEGWVSVNPEGITGKLTTEKKNDRYSFTYDKGWFESLDTKIFYVRSSHYIDVVQDSDYVGHLIVPALDKWIDFEEIDGNSVIVNRINDNEIEVIVNPKLKGKDKLKFNSIGDLNIQEINLTWNKINVTNDIRSEITDIDAQSIQIGASFTGISTYADNFSVTFDYDGSTQTSSVNQTTANALYWNYVIPADPITTDSEIRNNFINYTITQNGTSEEVIISQNQSVFQLLLASCNATFNVSAINFTLLDEVTLLPLVSNIDASIQYSDSSFSTFKNANFELTGANNYSWCIAPANATIYATTNGFTYGGGDYDIRQYTFSNTTLSNETKQVNLYLLNESLITDVILKVVDESDTRVQGATINIQRFYPGTGEYLTTEIVTTDWNGLAQAGFILDDVYYAFTISVAGYNATFFEPAQVYTTQLVFKLDLTDAVDSFSSKVGWTISPDSSVLVGNTTFGLSTISSSNSIEWYSVESTFGNTTQVSNDTTIAGGTTSVFWTFNETGYVYNTYTIKVENEESQSFEVVYVVNDFTPGNDSFIELKPALNELIPEFWRILFAVFISLIFAIIMMSIINVEMGGLVSLIIQILFAFYGWIPIPFIIVEAFIIIGLYILFTRGELS